MSALLAGGDTSSATESTSAESSDSTQTSESATSGDIDKSKYETVLDEETFNTWLGKLQKAQLIAFDTETSRFHRVREVRSARKRPKSGKWPKFFGWFCGEQKPK